MSKFDDLKFTQAMLQTKIIEKKAALAVLEKEEANVSHELNSIRNAGIDKIEAQMGFCNSGWASFIFDNRVKLREVLATLD
jgi:hypothetical protein